MYKTIKKSKTKGGILGRLFPLDFSLKKSNKIMKNIAEKIKEYSERKINIEYKTDQERIIKTIIRGMNKTFFMGLIFFLINRIQI